MRHTALFIDLDDTLYPPAGGMMDAMLVNINDYILAHIEPDPEKAPILRERLHERYGTTGLGLAMEFKVDYLHYLQEVHRLPIEDHARPNPQAAAKFAALPLNKYVFTSSYRKYAARVLKLLGMWDAIDGLVDSIDVYPYGKPMRSAFERALAIMGEDDPSACIFVDDGVRNIAAAHDLGMYAVHITWGKPAAPAADTVIETLDELFDLPVFQP